MKTLKLVALLIAFIFTVNEASAQQTPNASNTTTKTKTIKKQFPHVSIAPFGGAIFPLTRDMREEFKPGGEVGLDLGYRVNKEVALYGKFSYMFMSSKTSGAPVGSYLEFSAGPRYYFTHPKLKSAVFFEAGVGAYNFRQNSFSVGENGETIIPQISNTKAGINGGIGASIQLSEAIDIMAKAKYHNVFTPNGSQGFMTVGGGLEFRFR
jgi:hypothetical protein